ncbi:hypothetical protein AAFF_G00263170 [Aldrovandia affinis]|uniref:Uncharacterized protein n=1 Tax=Aldrovandia affinis TaxID=143900 RepID=A0AAD7WTV5_9TELE|nr:hypothetical protein AAFF_G00263170 [Aldrovandia affinis]
MTIAVNRSVVCLKLWLNEWRRRSEPRESTYSWRPKHQQDTRRHGGQCERHRAIRLMWAGNKPSLWPDRGMRLMKAEPRGSSGTGRSSLIIRIHPSALRAKRAPNRCIQAALTARPELAAN